MKNVSYRIRKLRQEEIHILDDFLYEAIFIPEGAKAPPIFGKRKMISAMWRKYLGK